MRPVSRAFIMLTLLLAAACAAVDVDVASVESASSDNCVNMDAYCSECQYCYDACGDPLCLTSRRSCLDYACDCNDGHFECNGRPWDGQDRAYKP